MTRANSSTEGYRPMLEEHRQLLREIEALQQWCHEIDELGLPKFDEAVPRVRAIREHLAEHFAHEEEAGYLAPAVEAAPQLAGQVQALLSEHAAILGLMDAFIDRLQQQSRPFGCGDDAWKEFAGIAERLHAHEAMENRLIQSAFQDDLGSDD